MCLHHAADGDAQETLLPAKIGCRTSLGAPDTCSGHGDALGEKGEVEQKKCGLTLLVQHVTTLDLELRSPHCDVYNSKACSRAQCALMVYALHYIYFTYIF